MLFVAQQLMQFLVVKGRIKMGTISSKQVFTLQLNAYQADALSGLLIFSIVRHERMHQEYGTLPAEDCAQNALLVEILESIRIQIQIKEK